jgi:2-(1,2-epoxy-1,2-dihydrophenyl)acetyl-CoA isomerase
MRVEINDGIAELWFDRGDAGNAVDLTAAAAFRDAAAALHERDDVRAVLLAGEGRMFCVGGDIGYFGSAEHRDEAITSLAGTCHDALRLLAGLDAPVVARVHGPAAGIGLSFALAADITIASDAAHFTTAYTGIGFSPDGGQTWLLPRMVGTKRAMELFLTNRRVKAAEALELGMVTEVVEADALDARVREVLEQLAAGPTAAYGAVKRLMGSSSTATFADQLEAEGSSIAQLADSPTGREGVAAFTEKRRPQYPTTR